MIRRLIPAYATLSQARPTQLKLFPNAAWDNHPHVVGDYDPCAEFRASPILFAGYPHIPSPYYYRLLILPMTDDYCLDILRAYNVTPGERSSALLSVNLNNSRVQDYTT